MKERISKDKKMTRAELKDVLAVNFEMFKDDPEFIDYITTLVIYLMSYEFDLDSEMKPRSPGQRQQGTKTAPAARQTKQFKGLMPRRRNGKGRCPHCHGKLEVAANICPYCLGMIREADAA